MTTAEPHHQLPAPAQVEGFRLLNLHLEVADGPPLPAAQVSVNLFGAPAYQLDGPKLYRTYLTPELAVQVGHGLIEVGTEALGGDGTPVADAVAPGVPVFDVAAMRRAAAEADAIATMRDPRG